jgi:hypothetical protein
VIETKAALRNSVIASAIAILTLVATAAVSSAVADTSPSSELRSGWRFAKGDHAGAEAADFDDRDWSKVRVLHDWVQSPVCVRPKTYN